jgi:histidinol phosphatase-like PHP family hydrolase
LNPFPIDHDLHCHTFVSGCSLDPKQNPDAILAFAKANGYTTLCFADHFWDETVPDPSRDYRRQTFELMKGILPLPTVPGVRAAFGCETEWCGGGKIGIAPERHGAFEFIVVPPNHFHMRPFVRPLDCNTPEQVADLLVTRLEELQAVSLPWEKVGIAHLNCGLVYREGEPADVFDAVPEDRFRAAMRFFADHGAGIELNCSSFDTPAFRHRPESSFRLFRMAKDEGCRFYLASDAHHPPELDAVPRLGPGIVEALGLDSRHLYRLP